MDIAIEEGMFTVMMWYSCRNPGFDPANRHSIERMNATMAQAMGMSAVGLILSEFQGTDFKNLVLLILYL